MNYSSPDYGGIGQQDTYRNMPQQQDPVSVRQSVVLTSEEERVLRDCSKEGITKRGIPIGLACGLLGLLGARAGPLMSKRFGVKPAVIGFGIAGYFVGRFSYTKVCLERVLEVPDGNLRKVMLEKGVIKPNENIEPYNPQDPSNFYANIEVPKDQDQAWDSKRSNSEIELPVTSSFDTVPSDYYAEIDHQAEEIKPRNYTSYDDLRKRNRQDFSNRMYPEQSQRYRSPDGPQMIRPRVPASPPENQTGSHQTKYGDTWD